MRLPLYSQNLHTLIIDGFPVTGFADGDWLGVKIDGGGVTRTQGSYGPVLNRVASQGGQIVIGLLPISPALGELLSLRTEVRTAARLFNMSMITGTEEIFSAMGCGFGDISEWRMGGPVMAPREFIIECIKLRWTEGGIKSQNGILGGLVNFGS